MKILLGYLLTLILPLACGGGGESNTALNETATVEIAAAEEVSDKSNALADGNIPQQNIETKIIKTSNLRFETNDINESYSNIQKAINKNKATIQSDVTGKDYNSVYRNITVRIPSKNFDFFIAEISKGVTHFERKEISSQDVTEQYIDLEARMNAKKNLEKRYLELLSKANKVSEILEIEKQLATIREEVEAKEGQLRYLKSQISMSTINIEMFTNNASESGATVSYGMKIWNAIKSGFNGLSSFIIGLITIWPFILILVVLFIFIRRKFFKKTV